MTIRRTLASAAIVCAATARSGPLAAQSVPAQAQLHLLAADAVDGRAAWVNPAGLARRLEASAGAYITLEDSSSRRRLSQGGVLLASRGFAFGWQRDNFAAGRHGDTYLVAAGLGDARLAFGAARRWYRRPSRNSGGYDLGLHATASALDLALSWRDIGSPVAGDSLLEETLVAGAGVSVLGRLRLSAEWHAATSGLVGRKVRAGLSLVPARGVLLAATADLSGNRRVRGVAVAVQLSRPRARFTVVGREPAASDVARQVGLTAMSISTVPARRFGR